MDSIVNKVAESGIVTIDLARYVPDDTDIIEFDLKPFLFREMILREKDYRAALQEYNWAGYKNKYTAVTCSIDAIIPVWAYMLAAAYLQPFAADIFFGSGADLKKHLTVSRISKIDPQEYADKRVVIKGCGDIEIAASAYVAVTNQLMPVVKSLMYGEPCSTVPIFKRK